MLRYLPKIGKTFVQVLRGVNSYITDIFLNPGLAKIEEAGLIESKYKEGLISKDILNWRAFKDNFILAKHEMKIEP